VFAKGHLKKYSQLVGVDEGDVLKDYYELTRSASMPPVISTRPRPRREMSPGPWIAVIVIIIVVASVYWWLTSRPVVVDAPAPAEEAAPAEEMVPQEEAAPEEVDEPEATEVDTTPDPEPQPEPVEAATNDGELRLLVTYSGDCWTEITDASGRRLFFDLGKEGRTVELSGAAPFNVLFGNAENVSLRVNGSDYAIGAADRRGRTARLTISGT